jgi:hypothetical protein
MNWPGALCLAAESLGSLGVGSEVDDREWWTEVHHGTLEACATNSTFLVGGTAEAGPVGIGGYGAVGV